MPNISSQNPTCLISHIGVCSIPQTRAAQGLSLKLYLFGEPHEILQHRTEQ